MLERHAEMVPRALARAAPFGRWGRASETAASRLDENRRAMTVVARSSSADRPSPREQYEGVAPVNGTRPC